MLMLLDTAANDSPEAQPMDFSRYDTEGHSGSTTRASTNRKPPQRPPLGLLVQGAKNIAMAGHHRFAFYIGGDQRHEPVLPERNRLP